MVRLICGVQGGCSDMVALLGISDAVLLFAVLSIALGWFAHWAVVEIKDEG